MIRFFILRAKPVTPAANKWGKQLATNCFFNTGDSVAGLFSDVYDASLGKMVFEEEQADPGTDPGNYEQMQWHALQGSRQKKASKLVHDESEDGMLKFAMRAQAVTREAGRMCAVWLMRASFGKMSKSGLPCVCD